MRKGQYYFFVIIHDSAGTERTVFTKKKCYRAGSPGVEAYAKRLLQEYRAAEPETYWRATGFYLEVRVTLENEDAFGKYYDIVISIEEHFE